jgi:hypothetical protein
MSLSKGMVNLSARRYIGPRTKQLVEPVQTDDYEDGYDSPHDIED